MYKNFNKSTKNISFKYSFLASCSIIVFLFTFITNTAYGATTTIVTDVCELSEPTGLAVDSSGDNIYVADNDGVEKIDISSNTTTPAAVGINNPYGVALDSSGNIYVSDVENNMIYKTDEDGTTPLVTANGGLSSPKGIALDSSNNIYVADSNNHNIRKFSSDGSDISIFNCNVEGEPYGVAADSDGNIYVAYMTNDESYVINQFNSNGGFIAEIGAGIFSHSSRKQIAVDNSDNIYISDSNEADEKNIIYKMNASGQIEVYASYASEYKIKGMAVDKNGNIYVAEGNDIKEITISTELKIDTSNPSNGTVGTAYSYTFTSTGGIGTKTYAVTEGSLPVGLILSEYGTLSGIPGVAGTSQFTITATDSATPTTSTSSTTVNLTVFNANSSGGSSSDSDSDSSSGLVQLRATVTNTQLEYALPLKITTERDGTIKGELEIGELMATKIVDSLNKQGKDTAIITMPDPQDQLSLLTARITQPAIAAIASAGINLELDTPNGGVTIPQQAMQNCLKSMDEALYFQFAPIRDEKKQAEIKARASLLQQQQMAALRNYLTGGLPEKSSTDDYLVPDRSMDISSNMPPGESIGVNLPIASNRPSSPALEAEILNNYGVYIEHSNGEKVIQKFDNVKFHAAGPIGTVNVSHLSNFTIIRLSQRKTDEGNWRNDEQGWKYIKNGEPATGWNQIGGSWYLMNSDGTMETGWQQLNGEWYYLYNDGTMASNTVIDGYELGENGAWLE